MAERSENYCEVIGNPCDQDDKKQLQCGACPHASNFVNDRLVQMGATGNVLNESHYKTTRRGIAHTRDKKAKGYILHQVSVRKGKIIESSTDLIQK